jgi:hypothetical protein
MVPCWHLPFPGVVCSQNHRWTGPYVGSDDQPSIACTMIRGELRHGLTIHISSTGPLRNKISLFTVIASMCRILRHVLNIVNKYMLLYSHTTSLTQNTDSTPQDRQLHPEPTHAKETKSGELSCEMKAVNIGWVLVSGKSRHTCLKTLPTCQCIYKQWTQVLKLLKHKWYYLHFNEKAVRVF